MNKRKSNEDRPAQSSRLGEASRSQNEARQHNREEQYEVARLRQGFIRCGGGYRVIRKPLKGGD